MEETTLMEIMKGIGDIKADVAETKANVSNLGDKVEEVRQEVSTIKSDVYNVRDILGKLDSRVAALESEPFSAKHIVVFAKWLFSKAGLYMLIPALALLNVVLAKLKLPCIDLGLIATFFGSP